MCASRPDRFDHFPPEVVRAADVANFALTDQGIERLQCFVDRRLTIGRVHLIHVDVVGLKSPQAGLATRHDVVPRRARVIRTRADPIAKLGRDDDVVAAALQRAAEVLLGASGIVRIGRIEVVDAKFQGAVDDRVRGGRVHLIAKWVAAQADCRNLQARCAEPTKLHWLSQAAALPDRSGDCTR